MAEPVNRPEVQLVWFKRDLRVQDHDGLYAASLKGPVIGLYILEPDYWRLADSSPRHWHFIRDSLIVLQADLKTQGVQLIIRIGEAVSVLEAIRQKLKIFTLWSHEETGNGWTYRRDIAVSQWAKEQGIQWRELPSHGVIRRLKSRDGWQGLRDRRMQTPLSPPHVFAAEAPVLASERLPAKDSGFFGSDPVESVQAGGRAEGLRTLQSFLDHRARGYMATLSKPGVSARHCSRLSAHIAFGTLSVREIEQATRAKLSALKADASPEARVMARCLSAFASRLAWRCHFVQKLEQQPDLETRCLHPAFEGMREEPNPAWLAAWIEGRTGYPLIDACMRSLFENGWITFRMRAMLVSFASYHLWLDWRITAPLLARLFTDYEPGIHYAQFQMQSGVTGINTIRIYNPIKQSYDQDAGGRFIRRYVPELANLPDAWLHEPWRHPDAPKAYPPPIVDHETATRLARERIFARRKASGFSADAKAVYTKLGSRNRPAARRKTAPKPPSSQLSLDF